MKISLVSMASLVSLVSVISSASFAVSASASTTAIRCLEGIDHGYSIYVAKNRKRATVSEVTIAGANVVGTLKCVRAKPTPVPAGAGDMKQVILTCSEPHMADAGYTLNISQGGIAGNLEAVLSEQSIIGPHHVATIQCFFEQ